MKLRFFAPALLLALALTGCATPRARTVPISAPPSVAVSGGFTHTVERGQTLYRIAKSYGVRVDELMRANGIQDPSQLEVGQRLLIPGRGVSAAPPPSASWAGESLESIRRKVGPRRASSRWRTITIHHSATKQGSAKSFHQNHTRRHMGGLFYHFVIGNGSGSRDGQVEVGFRWTRQIKANRPMDIQICLVGDFSRQNPSDAQFESVVRLTRLLQEQYGVPDSAVRRHEDIPGKHTECPGRFFPWSRFLQRLSQES